MASRADTSEIVDLQEICARPTAKPARDLTPPDLRSMCGFTTDLTGDDEERPLPLPRWKQPRTRLAAIGIASVFLAGLAIVGVVSVRGGASHAPARTALAAKVPAPSSPTPAVVAATQTAQASKASPITEPPPPASNVKLPPPPTTGASPVANAPPPRAYRPVAQAKPATAGPKMTKVQSTGVAR
ncbi:MAG: hypothetical protein JST00_45440 [Deltaproteobacteria bacterium]|nr:hypothetical protein [Deltaproteobacteria bacterium]